MTGTLIAIGCSATGVNYIPNLEADALFVADCYENSHKLFSQFDDYPIAEWDADIITGQVLDYKFVLDRIAQLPRAARMTIYVSAHGFTHKIKGKKHLCVYLGDSNNWVPAAAIVDRAAAMSSEPGVEHVQLIFDTCYSGLSKLDMRKLKSRRRIPNTLKRMLTPKTIDIRPKALDIELKGTKHKRAKLGIINVCKGKQTSFARIDPDNYVLASTNGHSLGTAALFTAANFYYSYSPGLNINVKGQMCKPRSPHAIMTLAQRRVNSIIKSIGLHEWLTAEPKTHIQVFNTVGKTMFY